jgi:hypothetical protein
MGKVKYTEEQKRKLLLEVLRSTYYYIIKPKPVKENKSN